MTVFDAHTWAEGQRVFQYHASAHLSARGRLALLRSRLDRGDMRTSLLSGRGHQSHASAQ